MKNEIVNFLKLTFLAFIWMVPSLPQGFCGSYSGLNFNEELDSLAEEKWNEETLYKIGALRLQRFVKQNPKILNDPFVEQQLPELLNEAKLAAQSEDYFMANQWLEAVWELVNPTEDINGNSNYISILVEDSSKMNNRSKFDWSTELISGVDWWRFQSGALDTAITDINITDDNNKFVESSSNPFSGFRLNIDFTSKKGSELDGHTFFKYSKDYLSGEAYFDYLALLTKNFKLRFKNRLEGTSFYGDFDLRYLQNLSRAALIINTKPISFEIGDVFKVRNYTEPDSIYSDYTNNSLDLTSRLNFGFSSQLSLRYRNVLQTHEQNDLNDYNENSFIAAFSHGFGSDFSLHLDNELRFRDYQNVPDDYFLQDYWENYMTGDLRFKFTKLLGWQLEGSLVKRQYDFVNENSLPDLLDWEVEPELTLSFGEGWKLGAGFHFGQETYEKLIMRFETSTDAAQSVTGIELEDFNEYGPVLSLEVFKINDLMLTIREAYIFRRYINSPPVNSDFTRLTSNAAVVNSTDYSLYSDRNNNRLLIFLSWTVLPKWQITVLANFDDNRSLDDNSSDSQNTMLDFELSYSF